MTVEPLLSLVVLHRALAEADLVDTALGALERKGFDVLTVVDVRDGVPPGLLDGGNAGVPHMAEPALVAVVLDVHPHREPRRRARSRTPTVDNHRLGMLLGLDQVLRQGWVQLASEGGAVPPEVPAHLLSWVHGQERVWDAVRSLAPERQDAITAEVHDRARWVTPPFPVLVELSGWAISARTDLVAFEGRQAVCRTFRKGREQAFRDETACYDLHHDIEAVARPLGRGDNWVVVPFHEDHVPAAARYRHHMPLSILRRCLSAYSEISAHGLGLLDFGPENVLVGPSGELALIDFEHLHRYEGMPPSSLLSTPLGLGRSFFDPWRAQHGLRAAVAHDKSVLKTYARHWQPLSGVPLDLLLDGTEVHIRARHLQRRMSGAARRLGRRHGSTKAG